MQFTPLQGLVYIRSGVLRAAGALQHEAADGCPEIRLNVMRRDWLVDDRGLAAPEQREVNLHHGLP